jgi:hypothetical protein
MWLGNEKTLYKHPYIQDCIPLPLSYEPRYGIWGRPDVLNKAIIPLAGGCPQFYYTSRG